MRGGIMTKDGKLSKRDMNTLNRAWEILSDWTQVAEDKDENIVDDYVYSNAMSAVVGLCEFIGNYER